MQYCLLFLLFVLRRTITASGLAPCLWPLLLPFRLFFFFFLGKGGIEELKRSRASARTSVCERARPPYPRLSHRIGFIHSFIYLFSHSGQKVCPSIVGLFFFFPPPTAEWGRLGAGRGNSGGERDEVGGKEKRQEAEWEQRWEVE